MNKPNSLLHIQLCQKHTHERKSNAACLGKTPKNGLFIQRISASYMYFFHGECAMDIVFRLTSILYKKLLFIYGIIGISIDLCLLLIIWLFIYLKFIFVLLPANKRTNTQNTLSYSVHSSWLTTQNVHCVKTKPEIFLCLPQISIHRTSEQKKHIIIIDWLVQMTFSFSHVVHTAFR